MSVLASKPLPGTVWDPLYPDSDGKPMGETDLHANAIILLREALTDFLADRPQGYVASQLVLYFQQGNPSGRRDPDILVALNAGKHARRSFRVWEERTLPNVLFEICSENTWQEDVGPKRDLYQRLGIREYFLFDPEGRWLDPVLQGFRLVNAVYAPINPGPDGSLASQELGVQLVVQGPVLRVVDARTGIMVPTRLERAERAEARAQEAEKTAERAEKTAEQARLRETEARDHADESEKAAERARLRETEARNRADESEKAVEQARLRETEARNRADESEKAAELARLREKEARDRADELAAELERLRAQLRQDNPPSS